MSPTLIIGAVGGVALLLAGAAVVVQTARLDAAQTRERVERERADANAAVVTRLQADAANSARIVAGYAAEISRLQEAERDLRNAIARAPITTACRDAPAIRSLLDGVRRERDAAADGRPPAAR